jgi:hypothetical protein
MNIRGIKVHALSQGLAPVDDLILGKVNTLVAHNFQDPAPVDHVLAQVYDNRLVGPRHRKARISLHSDKTKDMPQNGVMAFVTAYSFPANVGFTRKAFDVLHHETSTLTTLHWKLKPGVAETPATPGQVSVTLYPGSVLVVPLSTNRLYVHEIKPSSLPIDKIPTRLGYVARCAKTVVVHDTLTHETFVKSALDPTRLVPLRPPTPADFEELRELYRRENTSAEEVEYICATHGPDFPYSMNAGDYLAPAFSGRRPCMSDE